MNVKTLGLSKNLPIVHLSLSISLVTKATCPSTRFRFLQNLSWTFSSSRPLSEIEDNLHHHIFSIAVEAPHITC